MVLGASAPAVGAFRAGATQLRVEKSNVKRKTSVALACRGPVERAAPAIADCRPPQP